MKCTSLVTCIQACITGSGWIRTRSSSSTIDRFKEETSKVFTKGDLTMRLITSLMDMKTEQHSQIRRWRGKPGINALETRSHWIFGRHLFQLRLTSTNCHSLKIPNVYFCKIGDGDHFKLIYTSKSGFGTTSRRHCIFDGIIFTLLLFDGNNNGWRYSFLFWTIS